MDRLKICWKTRFGGPFLHLRSRSSRFSSMKWSHEPQFWSFGSFSPVLVNTLFEVDTVNGTVSHQWESWVQLYCFASKVSQKTRKQDWVRVRFCSDEKDPTHWNNRVTVFQGWEFAQRRTGAACNQVLLLDFCCPLSDRLVLQGSPSRTSHLLTPATSQVEGTLR